MSKKEIDLQKLRKQNIARIESEATKQIEAVTSAAQRAIKKVASTAKKEVDKLSSAELLPSSPEDTGATRSEEGDE